MKYNFKSRQYSIHSTHSLTLCGSAFPAKILIIYCRHCADLLQHNNYFFLNCICLQNTVGSICNVLTCTSLFQPSLSTLCRPAFSVSAERSVVSCCEPGKVQGGKSVINPASLWDQTTTASVYKSRDTKPSASARTVRGIKISWNIKTWHMLHVALSQL